MASASLTDVAFDLIDAAYAAATDPGLWPEFASRFERGLGSAVVVYAHPIENPRASATQLSAGFDPDVSRAYNERLNAKNILIINAARTRASILTAEEVVSREELEASEFFNEFMAPQGLGEAVNLTLVAGGRHRISLAAMRSKARGGYGSEERRLLERLAPHLQRGMEVAQRLDLLYLRGAVTFAAFERLAAAAALVDDEGRVLFANGAARRLFRKGEVLTEFAGRLRARNPALSDRLARAVRTACARRGRGDILSAPRSGGRPALSVTVAPADRGGSVFALTNPAALVLVHDPEASAGLSEEALRARYDVTPAEARLAVALCAGESLSGFAESAGVSVTTAKTHLNALFAKVEVNRQADLVRALLSDPALRMATAPSA